MFIHEGMKHCPDIPRWVVICHKKIYHYFLTVSQSKYVLDWVVTKCCHNPHDQDTNPYSDKNFIPYTDKRSFNRSKTNQNH